MSDAEKIVGYVAHGRGEFEVGGQYPEYVSLEMKIEKQPWRHPRGSQASEEYLSFSATSGYIMSESELDKVHDDYIENLDMEGEYGHLADEAHKTGTSREEFLEGLREDLDDNWPEPFELNQDIGEHKVGSEYYYGTGHTWGGLDLLNGVRASIPGDDFEFIDRMANKWNGKPISDIPPEELHKLKEIFASIDNAVQMEIGLRRKGRKRTKRFKRPGQQRLEAFRRPHPVVPVRTHLRRVR